MTSTTQAAACLALALDGDKVLVVSAANSRAIDIGVTAKKVLSLALPELDGRGGGKDDFAQGSGSKISGMDSAIAQVKLGLQS